MTALHRKLLRDLWRARGPAFAIALVIAAGVSMFVLLLSTFDSLSLTRQEYYDRYRFADVFASLKRAPDAVAAELAAIPGVARVDTRVVIDVTLDLAGHDAPLAGRLVSIPDAGPPALDALFLAEGRGIEPGRDDEVLMSETFANANHLVPGDTIGAVINGRRRDLRIVGLALSPEYVYAVRPGELVADEGGFGIMWMGRRALGAAYQMEDAFNDVALTLARGASPAGVITDVDRVLTPYGGLGAIPRSQQLSNFFLQGEMDSLAGMGRIVPAIFLAIAAFLLNIVLTRLVAIQRPQLAVLKAVGYTNAELGWHVGEWSLLVGLAGAALGVATGAAMGRGMTAIYTGYFHFPILTYRLAPRIGLGGVLVAVVAALAGGLRAVRHTVRLAPAEAMRPDAPAVYHVTWLERLGFRHWISEPTRIVIRNLQRHPSRAALSTLGIALGGAMLIVATFTIDSMNDVIDTQFNIAQVYDASVTFVEPVSAGAGDELARLPGVVQVEGFRAVPVRLRAGPRSRTAAILGVPAAGRLFQVVGANGRAVPLPPSGLVLSSKLADLLNVRAGDTVTVEVLDGRRPVLHLAVTRLVDDLMGLNAYMNVAALHGQLEEGGTLSGAYLQVDSTSAGPLYSTLKQTPAVAGVLLRSEAVANLNKTLAQSVGITRTVSIIFAAIIAFGVVYNAARISLSERDRELATLRIIGFTRAEIAYVLLAELALITLASLPLGAGIGYGLAALTVRAFATDVYRLPLVVTPHTYAVAMLTTIVTAVASALIVRERLDRLDLIAVLKTRE